MEMELILSPAVKPTGCWEDLSGLRAVTQVASDFSPSGSLCQLLGVLHCDDDAGRRNKKENRNEICFSPCTCQTGVNQ